MVFGQDGDTRIGCGIMVLDMEVLILGVMDIIIIGQDHSLSMGVCMTHLILFGDIMTHFIMAMVMAMLIHMDIIHGGDHTIPGIITIHMEEVLTQMFPLLLVEGVQEMPFRLDLPI